MNPENESVVYKNRHYCESCLELKKEEQEQKDIFLGYDDITLTINTLGYSGLLFKKHEYYFVKELDYFIEVQKQKKIEDKSQIANRIQYIKQSGYIFKEYFVYENSLTIVFE